MYYFLIYLGIAYICSSLLVFPFSQAAKRYDIVSEVDANVNSRSFPISFLGGGALYFGFVVTLLIFFFLKMKDPEISISIPPNKLLGILIGAALISLAGLIKDIYDYNFVIRLAFQIVAAFLLVIAGFSLNFSFLQFGEISLGDQTIYIGSAIATIAWTVLLINLIDLSDFSDAMTTSIGLLMSVFLFAIAMIGFNYETALLAAILSGTLLGVLFDQITPSNILLGKMGSGFIGFLIATITLDINYSVNNSIGSVAPILLLIVPVVLAITPFLGDGSLESGYRKRVQNSSKKESSVLFYACLLTAIAGFFAVFSVMAVSVSTVVMLVVIAAVLELFISIRYNGLVKQDS